ncbi:hypothetical protein, partial [Acinetobacter baumannii]|uniref:hypothetical protein n=1 Tax=Acinetobacter baumannii TaxID=470 RepID=UPI0013CF9BCE
PAEPRTSAPASLLRTAARLAERLEQGSVLYVADDDARAAALADLLRALAPDACVAHVPASDALPGDDAPASPANAG